MKKKVLSMTLVLAMSAAALAGCRSTDSGAQASKAETSASTEAAPASMPQHRQRSAGFQGGDKRFDRGCSSSYGGCAGIH